jgi:hypothetical protein
MYCTIINATDVYSYYYALCIIMYYVLRGVDGSHIDYSGGSIFHDVSPRIRRQNLKDFKSGKVLWRTDSYKKKSNNIGLIVMSL